MQTLSEGARRTEAPYLPLHLKSSPGKFPQITQGTLPCVVSEAALETPASHEECAEFTGPQCPPQASRVRVPSEGPSCRPRRLRESRALGRYPDTSGERHTHSRRAGPVGRTWHYMPLSRDGRPESALHPKACGRRTSSASRVAARASGPEGVRLSGPVCRRGPACVSVAPAQAWGAQGRLRFGGTGAGSGFEDNRRLLFSVQRTRSSRGSPSCCCRRPPRGAPSTPSPPSAGTRCCWSASPKACEWPGPVPSVPAAA